MLPKLSDGSIILCHNNGYKIEQYLPTLIESALAQGYSFVTVSDLLLDGETLIDVNGVQNRLNDTATPQYHTAQRQCRTSAGVVYVRPRRFCLFYLYYVFCAKL